MTGVSWEEGCPVGLDMLRLVTVDYWGFDGGIHRGELVVHVDHTAALLSVFGVLFEARFPIAQVRLIEDFGGDDDASMAANNTSAFNCRRAAGSQRWSEHAFGAAIDINPVQNPYVTSSGEVMPLEGRRFLNRSASVRGMILADGVVVEAFAAIGWAWGGSWASSKDYQHFSAAGR